MDVTPTDQMHNAIMAMADTFIGPAPMGIEKSSAANRRRSTREAFVSMQYRIVAMSMRVGGSRALAERGIPVSQAPMKG